MSSPRPAQPRAVYSAHSVSATVAESPNSSQQLDSAHSGRLFSSSASRSVSSSSRATVKMRGRRPASSIPKRGKPAVGSTFLFRHTNGLATDFVPGRDQHIGRNSQSLRPTAPMISREGAVRSGVSSPMDPRGSRNVTNQGVDTPPSSSFSGIRETISPSPNTSDFIAKDTINNNLPPTPVSVNGIIINKGPSNGLPPGVPTGPAAYRNRQSPPPNAPKGPASQRRRVPAPSVPGPGQQQRSPTSYPVSYSNSMTWKSTDVQKRETLEKMAKSYRHTNTDNLFELRRRFLEWKVVYEKDRIARLENEKKDRAEGGTNQGNQGEHAYHPLLLDMNTIWGDCDGAPTPAKVWPKPDCRHLPVSPSYSQIQADQNPFPGVIQLNARDAVPNASIDQNEHDKENLPPMPGGNTHCPRGVCIGAWSDPYNVLKIMELLELDIPNMENLKDVRSQDNDDITKLISEVNETNLDDIELN